MTQSSNYLLHLKTYLTFSNAAGKSSWFRVSAFAVLDSLRNSLIKRDAHAEALLNDTMTFVDTEAAYDANLMIVDLSRCLRTLTDAERHRGFIVSSYGWRFGECTDYTSFPASAERLTITSSAWGPVPPKQQTRYHQWTWLKWKI